VALGEWPNGSVALAAWNWVSATAERRQLLRHTQRLLHQHEGRYPPVLKDGGSCPVMIHA
jgi:hypothetical protein